MAGPSQVTHTLFHTRPSISTVDSIPTGYILLGYHPELHQNLLYLALPTYSSEPGRFQIYPVIIRIPKSLVTGVDLTFAELARAERIQIYEMATIEMFSIVEINLVINGTYGFGNNQIVEAAYQKIVEKFRGRRVLDPPRTLGDIISRTIQVGDGIGLKAPLDQIAVKFLGPLIQG